MFFLLFFPTLFFCLPVLTAPTILSTIISFCFLILTSGTIGSNVQKRVSRLEWTQLSSKRLLERSFNCYTQAYAAFLNVNFNTFFRYNVMIFLLSQWLHITILDQRIEQDGNCINATHFWFSADCWFEFLTFRPGSTNKAISLFSFED